MIPGSRCGEWLWGASLAPVDGFPPLRAVSDQDMRGRVRPTGMPVCSPPPLFLRVPCGQKMKVWQLGSPKGAEPLFTSVILVKLSSLLKRAKRGSLWLCSLTKLWRVEVCSWEISVRTLRVWGTLSLGCYRAAYGRCCAALPKRGSGSDMPI